VLQIQQVITVNPEIKKTSTFFYGYIVVIAAFTIAVAVEGLLFSFGVFFKPLLSEFGWTRAMTSGAMSFGSVLRIPLSMVSGRLTDKLGSRVMLTACGFFIGLGYLLMSQINALWQLYLFYGGIVAIGMSCYWVPLISIIPRWFASRRGLMMGIVACGIGVGQLIYPPLADWLIYSYGWRISYLVTGGVSMVMIILCAQFIKPAPDQNQKRMLPHVKDDAGQRDTAITIGGGSTHQVIRTKEFWMLCAIFLPWMYCMATTIVHIVIHAIGVGMSSASAAGIISVVGIAGITARLVFGRLADKVGIKPVLLFSFALFTFAFLWLLVASGTWMLYLFAVMFGIAYATFELLHSPLIAEVFGLSSLGSITGDIFAVSLLGFILGPVLTGHIFDITGSYTLAFIILAGMSCCSLISVILLPLTGVRKE